MPGSLSSLPGISACSTGPQSCRVAAVPPTTTPAPKPLRVTLPFFPKRKRLISGSSAHRAAPAGCLISELQEGRRKRAVLGNGGAVDMLERGGQEQWMHHVSQTHSPSAAQTMTCAPHGSSWHTTSEASLGLASSFSLPGQMLDGTHSLGSQDGKWSPANRRTQL